MAAVALELGYGWRLRPRIAIIWRPDLEMHRRAARVVRASRTDTKVEGRNQRRLPWTYPRHVHNKPSLGVRKMAFAAPLYGS